MIVLLACRLVETNVDLRRAALVKIRACTSKVHHQIAHLPFQQHMCVLARQGTLHQEARLPHSEPLEPSSLAFDMSRLQGEVGPI